MPFSLFIFVYDECRRFIMRRNPGGWVELEHITETCSTLLLRQLRLALEIGTITIMNQLF